MIERQLVDILKNRLEKFPILTLVGPRQSGKSTLLRNYFPDYEYINLERPDYRHLVMDDPIGFLSSREKALFLMKHSKCRSCLVTYRWCLTKKTGRDNIFSPVLKVF